MARGAAAAWAWPLAGLAVALPAAGLGWAALMLGLPAPVAAGLVLALQVLITGALHEDGLADCADGFWGGWTRARRLEIMADSRIGAYGVLALILGLGLGWAALSAAMAGPGWALWLISAALMSRGAMVWGMASLPRARPGGLSARVGRPSYRTAGLALGIAAAGSLGLLGLSALLPLALSAICLLALRRLAQNRIGGQTGDVLGGMQASIAILVLICASAGL